MLLLAGVLLTPCLFSCVMEDGPEGDCNEALTSDGKVNLLFRISSLDIQNTSDPVSERIKSLRIIVLGEENIECNRLMDLNTSASTFSYDFIWKTDPGLKQLYLIANEASVTSLTYQPEEDVKLPERLPDNLPALLNLYMPTSNETEGDTEEKDSESSDNTDAAGVNKAEEFINVMNSIYFEPDYSIEDGKIFIPYTACYTDINAILNNVTPIDAYLVPVATKFVFNFTNNRTGTIQISDISLSYYNTENFLFARVGEDDYYKSFGSSAEPEYWINWLAKVSAASWQGDTPQFGPNQDFNNLYGWIADYALPLSQEEKDPLKYTFVPADKFVTVRALKVPATEEEEPEPGTLTVGPFYLPESRNFINASYNDAPMDSQGYFLSMVFKDMSQEGKRTPTFENVSIDNLKALFRNTFVVIDIVMGEGGVDAYAEIAPWNKKYSYGWVIENSDSGQTPMLLKKFKSH